MATLDLLQKIERLENSLNALPDYVEETPVEVAPATPVAVDPSDEIHRKEFVNSIKQMVERHGEIFMANLTNPTFGGIRFSQDLFPEMRLKDVIREYTDLEIDGETVRVKPKKGKKTNTLKTPKEFNDDFEGAFHSFPTKNWAEDNVIKISLILNRMGCLDKYDINSSNPRASLDTTRFLINDATDEVSLIPEDN